MKFLDFIGGVWEMYNNLNNGQGNQQGYWGSQYGYSPGVGEQGYEQSARGYNGTNGYGGNQLPAGLSPTQGTAPYGSQVASPGAFTPVSTPYATGTQLCPTGGIYAHQLGLNSPYFVPQRGTFRKPTQAEILTEICLATFGTDQGITKNNIEDGGEVIRHVCNSGTLLHYLPRVEYPVTLPNGELVVIYYVHADCGTFTYVGDSLRA